MDELDRRELLGGVAVALGVGLAGCSGGGGDDGGDGGGDDNNTSDDGQNDGNNDNGDNSDDGPSEAQQSFDAAVETLSVVEGELATYRAAERDPTAVPEGGIDAGTIEDIRSRIGEAETALEGIDASGDLSTQVSIALDVAAFQRTLTDALDLWRQRDAAYRAAFTAQADEEYRTAASEFGAAAGALGQYRSLLAEIQSAHGAIDSGAFEVEALSYGDPVWAYLRVDSEAEIGAREQFLSGEEERASGLAALFEAEQSWDGEDWAAARQGYQEAGTAFGEASSAYQSVLDNADTPDVFQQTATERADEAAGLVEAMDLLVEATEEAEAGNREQASLLRQQAREQFTT